MPILPTPSFPSNPTLDPDTPGQGINDISTLGIGLDIFQGGGPELARITATDYQFFQGLLVGPVATSNSDSTVPSVAVMRVHKLTCFKVIRWVAGRMGSSKPVLPSPNTQNANEVLIHQEIGGSLPGSLADGQSLWSMRGIYVYALVQPPQPGDTLTLGGSWIDPTKTASVNTILPSDFALFLSGPAPSVTSLVPSWASFVSA